MCYRQCVCPSVRPYVTAGCIDVCRSDAVSSTNCVSDFCCPSKVPAALSCVLSRVLCPVLSYPVAHWSDRLMVYRIAVSSKTRCRQCRLARVLSTEWSRVLSVEVIERKIEFTGSRPFRLHIGIHHNIMLLSATLTEFVGI